MVLNWNLLLVSVTDVEPPSKKEQLKNFYPVSDYDEIVKLKLALFLSPHRWRFILLGNRETAYSLTQAGSYISIVGGLANIALGILHFIGVRTPFYYLNITGPLYWMFGLRLGNVIPPILIGLVGGAFAIAALGLCGKIDLDPLNTGVKLIIYGVIAGAGTWGIGGVLIVIGGILSIIYNYERRKAQIPTAPTKPVREPPKVARVGFCPNCGSKVEESDAYCFACGQKIR